MVKISFTVDEDNDLNELKVYNPDSWRTQVYTLDNVYESKYGELFDDLNILIDAHF